MRPELSIADVREALADAGLEEPLRVDGRTGLPAVLGGFVRLDGRRLELRIELGVDFPLSLPIVRVLDHEVLGFVPHLTQSGVICYHEGEGTVQSLWHPEQTAAAALRLACKTLRESLAGLRDADFVEEMEWWWSRQRGCWRAWSSRFDPGEQVKTVQFIATFFGLGVLVDKASWTGPTPWETLVAAGRAGLYVPLERSLLDETLDPRALLSVGGLRKVLLGASPALSEDNGRLLRARLRKGEAPRFLVLGVPRASGDRALIAVDFGASSEAHPLRESAMTEDSQVIVPVLIDRL
ncbi:MAG: hypothetical protein KC457_33370, partial [Myxococcales bacterium]|nr:hypothetical protein [Myxococcales bacterium]